MTAEAAPRSSVPAGAGGRRIRAAHGEDPDRARDGTEEEMARALHLPPGLPGSGRRRYAAAMWFHARGRLGARALEVFRILSTRDGDDPAPLLGAEPLPPPAPDRAAAALAALRSELLSLLHRSPGRGIAETRAVLASLAAPPRPVATDLPPAAAAHLPAALAALGQTEPTLSTAIAGAADHLPWTVYADYAPGTIGPRFAASHAFCTLAGESHAVWDATGVDVGLFLMAPRLFYRDHAHPAPELYLPLTGPHSWRFRPGGPLTPLPAFRPVWNDPEAPHATMTGEVPFLCLYAWLAHPQAAARLVPAPDWEALEA